VAGSWVRSTGERAGYLLAFGYLIGLSVLGVVPEISPAAQIDAAVRDSVALLLPLALPLLLLFPARAPQRKTGETFDLFYGMLVFLVLAVLVLGALAYMPIGRAGYIESLFKTSLTVAGALLVVAWAWNPRGDFSGIGSAISRYLLSLGMPPSNGWCICPRKANGMSIPGFPRSRDAASGAAPGCWALPGR
jgi:hypothetical protein